MASGTNLAEVKYKQVLDDVKSSNCIRYAAYRTAAKIGILQTGFGLDNVGITLIKRVFEQHRILSTDLYLSLSDNELENILYDIFFATSKIVTHPFDVNLSVTLTKLFLMNVYESKSGCLDKDKKITVLEAKVGIVVLCHAPLQAKYQYWFAELCDHNLRLSRRRLSLLLQVLMSITNFLSEQNTFSQQLLKPTLDSCFNNAYSSLGINESDFLNWVLQEPQFLVWLSTFYRLSSSENVAHDVHCAVCGIYPIIGLRYHCLRCIRYNLCQVCFFTGRTSKRHKTSHIIREYCAKTTAYETTVAFLRGFLNRLCGNKSRLQYLPAQPEKVMKSNNISTDSAIASLSVCSNNPERELERIIGQIERESRLMQNALDKGSAAEIIYHHTAFLQQHLDRLKALQSELRSGVRMTSTPMRTQNIVDTTMSPISLITDGKSFDNCCRITKIDEEIILPCTSASGFSTWIEEAGGIKNNEENISYSKQLEKELDIVMEKLNKMLESSFTPVTNVESNYSKGDN